MFSWRSLFRICAAELLAIRRNQSPPGSALFQNSSANAWATAFNGGHNLHTLTYQNILPPDFMLFIFPIFPPNCDQVFVEQAVS